MTKFEAPSFSVGVGGSKEYRDNWEKIFGKKKDRPDPWAAEREAEPKTMSDLPPPREAQAAPEEPVKPKKARKKKPKNEKFKTKKKQK